MEPQAPGPAAVAAPPVVVVVVTRDVGDWLEEVLQALAAQTYPNLSVLVIDAASHADPTPRIAAVIPTAYVRRLATDEGYGASTNEVLEVVEGAAFFLLCHDDVAPEPDAVHVMVEEAFRSNAGIVGPKLVRWDDPRRLLQVGESADKLGMIAPLVEAGELDQEQHDSVRDVFAVPGACTLVRADLFTAIGGFDPGITFLHDDLNLCWRAHIAGARVLVAPAARVRHLEALGVRRPEDDRRRLQMRHRVRSVLTCYSTPHLLRVLPQAVLLAIGELLYALVVGRRQQAADIAHAWRWNLSRLGEIRAARARVRGFRQVSDAEVRRFQTRGYARVTRFLRGQIGHGDDRLAAVARSGRELAGSLRGGSLRTSLTVWTILLSVLVAGSRTLIVDGVPAVGELVPFGDGPTTLLREWLSGFRSVGLGSEAPAPTALGFLGLLGVVLGGAMGLLRTLLVVGLLPLGAWGVHRLAAPLGSSRGRLVAVVAYAAIPLPYNALASGRWSALVLWAAMPWMVERLALLTGVAPYGWSGGSPGPGVRAHRLRNHAVALGFGVAVASVIAPVAPLVLLLAVAGIVIGSVLALEVAGTLRVLAGALLGVAVAAVLHVPWTLDFITPGATWTSLVGAERNPVAADLGRLLRFETGDLGAAPVGYVFLAAAALPLLIGRGWRFSWAVRGWTMALVAWGVAWAGQHDWAPPLPHPDVLLGPAVAGLALCCGLGVVAFEVDLPGYRFGWRQLASGLALAAVAVGTVPVLGASLDGRWSLPSGDFNRALRFLDGDETEGGFRVLWLGDPEVLPLGSWELAPGLAYATSDDGPAVLSDLWAGSDDGPTALLADAVRVAQRGQTTRLGRLLAPMGVHYVVIVERLAPSPFADEERPPGVDIAPTLSAQLDLAKLDVPEGLTVYRNQAAIPTRSAVAANIGAAGQGLTTTLSRNIEAEPVLDDADRYARWKGPLEAGSRVLLANAASSRWELEVDDRDADRSKAFGWANAFDVPSSGQGELRFRTPPSRWLLLVLQAVLWLAAIRSLLRMRLGPPEETPA